ncbi:MAG: HNH endonuclease signature motif containing protein [Desulfobacteraceae bacterium]
MAWESYFEERKFQKVNDDLTLYGRVKKLWQVQKGKCPICKEDFTKETWWHIHHVIPKLQGGKDILSTLQLLHPNCHRQLHNQDRKCVTAPN